MHQIKSTSHTITRYDDDETIYLDQFATLAFLEQSNCLSLTRGIFTQGGVDAITPKSLLKSRSSILQWGKVFDKSPLRG